MRRLAAVVAVDVVGYSRHMAADEDSTLAAWMSLRALIDPVFEAGGARIVKSTGDGILVESPSVIEAARAALTVQETAERWNSDREIDRRLLLRIGVNVGDIIVTDDSDIYGNGVNVAARLEALAKPGGICLSDAAYQQIRGRIDAQFTDRGNQWVKNMPAPIRVWEIGKPGTSERIGLGVAGLENIEPLGQGGNAVVYRAHQPSMDRWVAVKVLTSSDEATRRRFDRERQTMGRLSQHPGIITIYDSGYTDTGRPYLIMPLMEHGTLQDRLDRTGPLPWAEAVHLIRQVAEAVENAHHHGVIHRDLKPSNVVIDDNGHPLVADFGIALLVDSSLTVTDLILTPAYSAPELFDGATPTSASDVYGLAATLCALITGTAPFTTGNPETDTLLALSKRIANDEPPDLSAWEVANHVQRTVARAMAKDPNRRQQSAEVFAAELAGSLNDTPNGARDSKVTVARPMPVAGSANLDIRRMSTAVGLVALVTVAVWAAASALRSPTSSSTTVTQTTSPPAVEPAGVAQPSKPDGVLWDIDAGTIIIDMASSESAVFLATASNTVLGYSSASGEPMWDQPIDIGGLAAGLVVTDESLVLPRSGSRLVYAVSHSGISRWQRLAQFEGTLNRPLVAAGSDTIVIGFGLGVAGHALTSGDEIWSNEPVTATEIRGMSADADLVAVTDGRSVAVLDGASGATRWSLEPPALTSGVQWLHAQRLELPSGAGMRLEQRIFLLTENLDLLAVDGTTGDLVWTVPVAGPPLVTTAHLFVSSVDGSLMSIDRDDGSILWENPEVSPASLPVTAGESIVVTTETEVIWLNPRSGSVQARMPMPPGAVPAGNLIASGDVVIVASGSRLFALDRRPQP